MESVKIEKLLDAYFEGTTSLSEEKTLQNYFNYETVAEHLVQYKLLFLSLRVAKEEVSSKDFVLPNDAKKADRTWWYSIAALLVVALAVAGFYLSQPQYTQEEQEALAAFEKSKEAMLFLSENLNRGAERLTFVEQFEITKDKIFE